MFGYWLCLSIKSVYFLCYLSASFIKDIPFVASSSLIISGGIILIDFIPAGRTRRRFLNNLLTILSLVIFVSNSRPIIRPMPLTSMRPLTPIRSTKCFFSISPILRELDNSLFFVIISIIIEDKSFMRFMEMRAMIYLLNSSGLSCMKLKRVISYL